MEKLKPCPFCGGEAKISHESEGVLVRCQKCGATSGWIDEYLETEDSGVKKAIGLWNRRAAYEDIGLLPDEIPHWIPVSVPPKKSEDYLCRYYFGGMAVSYFGTAGEGWNSAGITHWMPLPGAPKEEK